MVVCACARVFVHGSCKIQWTISTEAASRADESSSYAWHALDVTYTIGDRLRMPKHLFYIFFIVVAVVDGFFLLFFFFFFL